MQFASSTYTAFSMEVTFKCRVNIPSSAYYFFFISYSLPSPRSTSFLDFALALIFSGNIFGNSFFVSRSNLVHVPGRFQPLKLLISSLFLFMERRAPTSSKVKHSSSPPPLHKGEGSTFSKLTEMVGGSENFYYKRGEGGGKTKWGGGCPEIGGGCHTILY